MSDRASKTDRIRRLPDQVAALVRGLTPEQLTTPYDPGEWTVAQNIHHLADVHMNVFIRFKLICVEDFPTLKPFEQNDWAETPDATNADVETSLNILRGVHARWVTLMESLQETDWARRGNHPQAGEQTLDYILDYFAGHGEAHLAQIQKVLGKMPQ